MINGVLASAECSSRMPPISRHPDPWAPVRAALDPEAIQLRSTMHDVATGPENRELADKLRRQTERQRQLGMGRTETTCPLCESVAYQDPPCTVTRDGLTRIEPGRVHCTVCKNNRDWRDGKCVHCHTPFTKRYPMQRSCDTCIIGFKERRESKMAAPKGFKHSPEVRERMRLAAIEREAKKKAGTNGAPPAPSQPSARKTTAPPPRSGLEAAKAALRALPRAVRADLVDLVNREEELELKLLEAGGCDGG